jgi:hypothetical protein
METTGRIEGAASIQEVRVSGDWASVVQVIVGRKEASGVDGIAL